MNTKALLKLTSSLVAVGALLGAAPALAQTANGWTGGSSYWSYDIGCLDPNGCAVAGNNLWNNSSNWSGTEPGFGHDVSIGLSTFTEVTRSRPNQHDTVVINAATNAQAGSVTIGFSGSRSPSGSFGSGVLTNNGSLQSVNNIVVGSTGTGTFDNNGTLDILNGSLIVGRGGTGTVNIGASATTFIATHLVVGDGSVGNLTANSDITVGGNTIIGQLGSANGVLTLTNSADLTTDGHLTVGELGTGTLDIGAGSTVTTAGNVGAGLLQNSNGRIDVHGDMINGQTLTIGGAGNAELEVHAGGSVTTTGRVALGTITNSSGLIVNRGDFDHGAGQVNGPDLVIGDHGRGRFDTIGAFGAVATTTTTGNVVLGGEENGVGIATVSSYGEMNTSGRLDIGEEGQGYFLVSDGGQATNAVGTIGQENRGRGYALVTGDGSLWDNTTSLTLADEAGAQGLLIINDGGTVRIDGGTGTLVIAADAGSTGVLNIGAMSPIGEIYGVDAEVSAYLLGLGMPAINADARGAGVLDAAFVEFGEGTGIVNFKTTETEADDYRFAAGFVGEGTVNHYEGFTVLDGDSSDFEGEAIVFGGTLVANNVLAGDVFVDTDGTLRIGHGGTTGDVVNDIASNGLVEFNRSDVYEFDSVIFGDGDVAQIGSGTTVLTGTNTYTGATSITNGTLQLGDGGTTGSIDFTSGVAIGTDGTLAFNRSDLVLFDRELTGTGAINHIGDGVTVLFGDNSGFVGHTSVDAGILAVIDVLGGTVDVNATGTLAGIGVVGSTVAYADGTIAPGLGNIGSLGVDGTFTQQADSTYQVEVLSTGETDHIHVTGAATLDPGAILNVTKLDPERYDLDRRYTVLTADGGLTGDYILTGDTFVSTFYQVEDMYDDNNAYLRVNQHRQFQEAGLTSNQIAAATAAQELKAPLEVVPGYETTGRPTNELFRAIAYLPTDELAQFAFDQISGEIYASTTVGLIEQSRFVRDATGQRIRDAFGDTMSSTANEGLQVWGRGFGSWSETDGDGNAGTFSHNVGGFVVGGDIPVTEYFRVGVLGGYSHSSFGAEGRGSSATSNNFDLGIYAGGEIENFGFRLGANHAWHSIETNRNASFPGFGENLSSSLDARTTQIYGDIGYTIDLGEVSFEPFVGLAYVNVDRGAYSETGGVAALSGSSHVVDATFATLGLRGSALLSAGDLPVKATGMIGWRHALEPLTPTATHSFAGSSAFTVAGVPLAQDVAVVEAGLETLLNEDLTLGVSYGGQFGSGFSDHGVRGTLNWKF